MLIILTRKERVQPLVRIFRGLNVGLNLHMYGITVVINAWLRLVTFNYRKGGLKQVPMPIKGFGINADAARLDNNLDTLARDLEYFAGLGFEYVEIPVHGVGAMIGGRLLPPRVEEICRLLARFPFRYTVHAPNP